MEEEQQNNQQFQQQNNKNINDLPENKEELQNYVGKRVEVQEHFATVKYAGPLTHEGKPENTENELWFGVEWDDPTRGKHNGTVKNVQYFKTSFETTGGSLIKRSKANMGIDILEGIFQKYFRDDIDQNIKTQIKDRILAHQDYEFAKNQSKHSQEDKQEQEEKHIINANNKDILVEFDENAYFETSKKHKKMVEFYGFDKIWEKINNMKVLEGISIPQVNISDIGQKDYLNKILPNLKILTLEKNLIFDWDQVFQIGYELPHLEELQIARNRMRNLNPLENREYIRCLSDGSLISASPVGIFKNLKYLNFIDMGLNWKIVSQLFPAFPVLEELILCLNDMSDTENLVVKDQDLQNLVFLNLENANLQKFEGLHKFGQLPKLQKLILNKNKLKEISPIQQNCFQNITLFSLEKNLVEDPKCITQISQQFPAIQILNLKHNPMSDKYGKSYVRQRGVAENPNVIFINGSDLKKYERKDCEIFYLRKTFDDYFKMKEKVYYDYDFEDFCNWAKKEHPKIDHLLKVYGNPYECQPKDIHLNGNLEGESQPKNIMMKIQIVIAAGPLLGKKPLNKKFPENTTVQNLRNLFAKLLQIPAEEQIIYYKVNQNDPMEILDEDHKTLSHYGIKDGSEITVSSTEMETQ